MPFSFDFKVNAITVLMLENILNHNFLCLEGNSKILNLNIWRINMF